MKLNLERWGETILGAIVAVVAVGFFIFASAQAGAKGPSGQTYDLIARFQNAQGVNVGTDVRISGIKVGVVRSMEIDPNTYYAKLTLAIDPRIHVLDDSTARVASESLLGGSFISIEPAGMDPIPAGGEIKNTQGYVDALTVLSSAVSGMAQNSQHSAQDAHP